LRRRRIFFEWYTRKDVTPEEEEARKIFNNQRGQASFLFESYKFDKNLDIPAYSLFSLMSYIYLTNRLGQAVIELASISLREPHRINMGLVDVLKEKYKLTEIDVFNLSMVIAKEISQQKGR
jgi:hypothetical protein